MWRKYLTLLDETAAAGGRMFAQVHSRSLSALLSFKTQLPFDRLPVWKELRALPLAEQQQRLRDPELRRRLVEAADERRRPAARVGTEARPADYDWILVFDKVEGPHRTVAEIARERGQHPAEAMIDLALEKDLDLLLPAAGRQREPGLRARADAPPAHGRRRSPTPAPTSRSSWTPRCRRTCSATGCATKQAFTLEQAVRMLTLVPATLWGFADRGLIREGMAADLVVFDPDTIAAEMPEVVDDLPAGARRLVQRAAGIAATVVNGEVAAARRQAHRRASRPAAARPAGAAGLRRTGTGVRAAPVPVHFRTACPRRGGGLSPAGDPR